MASFVPRRVFPVHNVVTASFVGHHRRALAELRAMARDIDFIIELRDSRAPVSSINPLFDQVLPGTPKLVLYTKRDLTLLRRTHIEPIHPDGMFQMVNADERKYANRAVAFLREFMAKQHPQPPFGLRVLVTGLPNSGKSSFINKIREVVFGKHRKKVARTGSQAGVTRKISENILICNDPKIYIYDTPGVSVPQAYDWEHMLKLALIGAVPQSLVDPVVLADYLLFHMNIRYPLGGRYPGPVSNDIHTVLWNIANTNRRKPKRETWDENATAAVWVDRFARGGIGKLQLDDLSTIGLQETMTKIQNQRLDLSTLPVKKSSLGRSIY